MTKERRFHAICPAAVLAAVVLTASTALADTILIDRDNMAITSSCQIKPSVYRIADADNNGVLHVKTDGVTIDFQGATLLGADTDTDSDKLTGIGVNVGNCKNVTIANATIHGYFHNIRLTDTENVRIERCDVSFGYGQRIADAGKVRDVWLVLRNLDAWRSYGAGIWIEKSENCRVVRCTGRRMQNGVLLVQSNRCEVLQSDFCFNSGWGIGLWESCDNRVIANRADFVNRPWGGGWGGDAAAIVVVNASHRNWIVGNSITHGGDGFFLTNRTNSPDPNGGSCDDNIIAYNDGSYSPHNAFEATFSNRNKFIGNLANHSDHGFWCGYSNDSVYIGNEITDNRSGGISTEHGHHHWVEANRIERNGWGVRFWHDPNRGHPSHSHTIRNNQFIANRDAVHVLQTAGLTIDNNEFIDNDWAVVVENTSGAQAIANRFVIDKRGQGFIRGDLEARENFWIDAQSRDPKTLCQGNVDVANIDPHAGVMTFYKDTGLPSSLDMLVASEWAPLDFTNALVYPTNASGSREVKFAVVGRGPFVIEGLPEHVQMIADRQTAPARVTLRSDKGGRFTARVSFRELDETEEITIAFLPAVWNVKYYAWPSDLKIPPDDVFETEVLQETTTHSLHYRWGYTPPAERVPGDYYALRATANIELPAGRYRLSTLSDDGVRVLVDDKVLFENWTWHHTTEDSGSIQLTGGAHKVVVEYFEINGAATLDFQITPESEPPSR